ncbi:Serine/Threonine protein kinase [Brazilian cedratvirus IHUMI]|uniref:Serine/Threonine protein kinase n=1 Tax=Brazilian cedratvirus IHUMI TaxID=2126980 RepID=A0A2R8FDK7_9VIRU|nr:Serine/Threonine protein kinase [Brazilian cedratvirus IHUMI]
MQGYKFLELLGRGSYGEVYKAEKEGEYWAVKKFKPISLLCRDVSSYCAEIDICLHLSSPYLIKGKEYFYSGSEYYLVMQLADCSLESYMSREKRIAVDLLIPQLLLCLQALQDNGLSHGDIKPTNFLIKDDRVLLTDFGLCRPQEITHRATFQTWGLDSPQNMFYNHQVQDRDIGIFFREVFKEVPDGFDSAGDVWALGVTIVHLLTGKFLFSAPDVNGFICRLKEYMHDPQSYLEEAGVNKMWFPLLLRLLCPSYKQRVKRISELTNVKMLPDDGFYLRQRTETKEAKLLAMMNWLSEVCDCFFIQEKTKRTSLLLLQHCHPLVCPKDETENMMLACSCLVLTNSVHQNKTIFPADATWVSDEKFTDCDFALYQNDLFDKLQGRVFIL